LRERGITGERVLVTGLTCPPACTKPFGEGRHKVIRRRESPKTEAKIEAFEN